MKFLYVIFLVFLIQLCSCANTEKSSIQVAGSKAYPKKIDAQLHRKIQQLTQSNFYTHTQAVRYLVAQGTDIVPMLYANKHLHREIAGQSIPVCLVVIEIIFSKANVDWVNSQKNSPLPEIARIAKKEAKRRS